MIHKIIISNFGSIRDSLELDLRIPGTTPDLPRFRASSARPETRLPSVVALVGPNGSGKTTILNALSSTARFAAFSHDRGMTGFWPFLAKESVLRPTRVQIDLDADWFAMESEERFDLGRYTLELTHQPDSRTATRVAYEALHIFPRGRPRRVFERRGDQPIFISRITGVKPGSERLEFVRSDASLVSTMAKLNVRPFARMHAVLGCIGSNLADNRIWAPDEESIAEDFQEDPQLVAQVSRSLRRVDLGIESLDVAVDSDNPAALSFKHPGLDWPVPFGMESAGTRNFVHLFPEILGALATGSASVLDALDYELHPDLAAEVLRWFQSPETNPHGAQLFCTLHNPGVLRQLEKDELVIVEKSRDGVTTAYGAWQVEGLRRSASLDREYRSGVLGGLPRIG